MLHQGKMKLKELAELLKMNRSSIKRWVRLKLIKATMISDGHCHPYWDVSQEQLDEYLEGLNG